VPQTYRKNKNSNDNTTPAKVITSPDGIKIQITAGRKLQVIRSFASDPEITDAQFRALVCIVDRLNEGKEGTDESRWGSSYPNFETLAKDIAKDKRSAIRIVKELEDGQRQTRSGGVTKFVPGKSVLIVHRSKDENDQDRVNRYLLKEWGAFAIDAPAEEGAVTGNDHGEGAVTCKEGCGHLQGRVPSPVKEGAVTAPNSTHLLNSETHLTDPPQLAPASGERGPADGLDDGQMKTIVQEDHRSRETAQAKASNDNQPVDDDSRSEAQPVRVNDNEPNEETEKFRKAGEETWLMFLKAPPEQHDEFIRLYIELAEAGEIKNSKEVRDGLKCHLQDTERKYQKTPVNFLKKQVWKTYRAEALGSSRSRMSMAI
jgi:hypothetical protein